MTHDPNPSDAFEFPHRPVREFEGDGQASLTGAVRFELHPDRDDIDLEATVDRILSTDAYTAGEWFDLPRPVYLVRDETVPTVYRIVITADAIALDILPRTDRAGLEAFYRRLDNHAEVEWTVVRHVESRPPDRDRDDH